MEVTSSPAVISQRVYGEAVKNALIVVWEAADRICGKRLKAVIPALVNAMERHGHLKLEAEVRRKLFSVSAATIDRALMSVRKVAGKLREKIRVGAKTRKAYHSPATPCDRLLAHKSETPASGVGVAYAKGDDPRPSMTARAKRLCKIF